MWLAWETRESLHTSEDMSRSDDHAFWWAQGVRVRQRVRIVGLVMPVIVHLVRGASVHRTALGLTVGTLRRVPGECVHVVAVHVPRMGLESHHVGRGGQAVTLTTLLLGDSSLRGEVAVRLVARREAGKPRGAADAVGMIGVGGARTAGWLFRTWKFRVVLASRRRGFHRTFLRDRYRTRCRSCSRCRSGCRSVTVSRTRALIISSYGIAVSHVRCRSNNTTICNHINQQHLITRVYMSY